MAGNKKRFCRRWFYRIHRWFRHNSKVIMTAGVIALVAIAGLGLWTHKLLEEQRSRHVTAGNNINVGNGYRNIVYKGKRYQYNSLITTVLYAGLDSEGELKSSGTYADAPRADTVYLAVLDKKNEKMTVMALNRDTMTDIRRFSANGRDRGTYVSHLCLAYSYGDGGKVSCENLREAVSNLLGGIPISEYVVMNLSTLPAMNDLVGGITLTIPNDDLADVDARYKKGESLKITKDNIEFYLRTRDIGEDFSNEGRIERQRAYIEAYIDKFKNLLKHEPEAAWKQIQEMEKCLQTSITRNKYLDLANVMDKVGFAPDDFYILEGEDKLGELHDEFYADQDALQKKIVEIFYEEI